MMRIFLIVLGVAIAAGALLFWVYLNGLAASRSTGSNNAGLSVEWFTGEAFWFFWLPCAAGTGIAWFGWMRR